MEKEDRADTDTPAEKDRLFILEGKGEGVAQGSYDIEARAFLSRREGSRGPSPYLVEGVGLALRKSREGERATKQA